MRVIRACRELGIAAVAVYSEADRAALTCASPTRPYAIGPAPSRESYLRIDRVHRRRAARRAPTRSTPATVPLRERGVRAGLRGRRDRLHRPARRGDRARWATRPRPAREAVRGGRAGRARDARARGRRRRPRARRERIGFPVMLKAAAGGGGKGMRLVASRGRARRRARARALARPRAPSATTASTSRRRSSRPRHVEIQVLADHHGNAVHLFERECSIQRRHQKVIEETPVAAARRPSCAPRWARSRSPLVAARRLRERRHARVPRRRGPAASTSSR